jgi:pimeloyl-ACP methyl ester carboxylesterase
VPASGTSRVPTAYRGTPHYTPGSLARLLRPIDLFVNSERIGSIRCPVVVLHGTRDWVVPCSHGRTLHKLAQHSSEPLWVGGRGHNDMPEAEIFRHICGFVADLK